MKKYKYIAELDYHIFGFSKAVFHGRQPIKLDDEKLRDELMLNGVFTLTEGGSIFYSGEIIIDGKSGNKYRVDADGFLEVDLADVDDEYRAVLEKGLIEA